MTPRSKLVCLPKPLPLAAASCIVVLFALVPFRQANAQQSPGVDPFDPASSSFFASPASIRPVQNKYPASVPFILWLKGCTPGQATPKPLPANSTYTITVAGAGLSTAAKPTVSDCKLTTTLNIDPAAATSGFFLVDIVEATADTPAKQVDRGNAILTLLDAAAGPTPSNPQVDVIWGVLSRHLCSDDFGNHVAGDVYCIEVKIGNNSGHQIQLAGIGFKPNITQGIDVLGPTPNISYQSVRASAQGYAFWSTRTLLINGSSAVGLLMASFNPFFHATHSVAHWVAGTAVASGLPGAIGQVVPDLSTRELNNLDDQSFRDNLPIPNNSQVRTMVFVERKLLDGAGYKYYARACAAIYKSLPDGGDSATANCLKKKDDPLAVKWALGRLVIVGDEVDFIQRVVVDSVATTQAAALNPVITDGEATKNTVKLTFQGNAPTGATATISSTADTNFSTAEALDVDKSPSTDPSTLSFAVSGGKTLTPGDDYTVTVFVPNVAPLTRIVEVPKSAAGPVPPPADPPVVQPGANPAKVPVAVTPPVAPQ